MIGPDHTSPTRRSSTPIDTAQRSTEAGFFARREGFEQEETEATERPAAMPRCSLFAPLPPVQNENFANLAAQVLPLLPTCRSLKERNEGNEGGTDDAFFVSSFPFVQ